MSVNPQSKSMPRVTITVPDKMPQPYRFPLDRQVVMIGRGSENDIAIDCGSISVRHAEMVRIEGGYELRDLGSTNGIKLDGRRSDAIALRHGATVRLGDVAFDFQLSEEERDAPRGPACCGVALHRRGGGYSSHPLRSQRLRTQ